MDLGLDEQQEMLKNFARDFLEKECPEQLVREMEEDEKGYSPELWQKMAQQGWMGLIIPENYGGTGMNICELVVLLEEFGRALVPGPFISTVVLGGVPIMEAGTEEQKQQFLPKIASGELIMTMALTEPSAKWTADGVQLEAKKDGSDYVLNGTKLFVQDAHVSDYMVVAARTGGSGEDGITLFLVDSKSPGIKFEVLKTIAADKQCEVMFENVKVPASNMLGAEGKGWPIIEKTKDVATVAACAYLVGLSQMDFDVTLNYAKERVQFGRPIGSFQAIQHKLADAVIDVDGSPLHHLQGRLEPAGRRAGRGPDDQHGEGVDVGRVAAGGSTRAADPRRDRVHEGVQDPAVLPSAEVDGADVGRRRLPPGAGGAEARSLRTSAAIS